MAEPLERLCRVLQCSPPDATEDALRRGSGWGSAAAPDLAVGDRVAQRLLGAIVGGVDRRALEEGEQVMLLAIQMPGETLVDRVGLGRLAEPGHPRPQRAGLALRGGGRDVAGIPAVTRQESLLQDVLDPPRKDHRAPAGGLKNLLAPPQQVSDAGLVPGLEETLVRRPAVVNQRARIVDGQQPGGGLDAALASDQERDGILRHRHMQPVRHPAHTPAGFIGHRPGRLGQMRKNPVILRQATARRPEHCLANPAATKPLDQIFELGDAGFQPRDAYCRGLAPRTVRIERGIGFHAKRTYAAETQWCGGHAKQLPGILQWGRALKARNASNEVSVIVRHVPSMGPCFESTEYMIRSISDGIGCWLQWGRALRARNTLRITRGFHGGSEPSMGPCSESTEYSSSISPLISMTGFNGAVL